jgi:transcription elongation factor Elf1
MEKIANCPFCNANQITNGTQMIEVSTFPKHLFVECLNCGAHGPKVNFSKLASDEDVDFAIRFWNNCSKK